MPTLRLNLAPPQTATRHRQLAEALTKLTAQLLGKRPEVTAVLIEDLPAARWYVGGKEARRPTALLEISITAGTNSPAEKAAFVAAAFAELERQLGQAGEGGDASKDGAPLEEATYVVVRELPASDWGYGGRTQQARKLEKTRAAVQAK